MIPIIGQPKVTDWALTLQLECSCGNTFMVNGKVGSGRVCGKCQRGYAIGPVVVMTPQGPTPTLGTLDESFTALNVAIAVRNPPKGDGDGKDK